MRASPYDLAEGLEAAATVLRNGHVATARRMVEAIAVELLALEPKAPEASGDVLGSREWNLSTGKGE